METSDWINISHADHCKWKQVTGLLFHMQISDNGNKQRFNGVRLILFIEIGVKLDNF